MLSAELLDNLKDYNILIKYKVQVEVIIDLIRHIMSDRCVSFFINTVVNFKVLEKRKMC